MEIYFDSHSEDLTPAQRTKDLENNEHAIMTEKIMTKRAVLYISGSIQRTGYRIKAVSLAKAFDITGIILNLQDGRVKIIAEGTKQKNWNHH